MIGWIIQQFAGFWWTCVAILLICKIFEIPIHVNLT